MEKTTITIKAEGLPHVLVSHEVETLSDVPRLLAKAEVAVKELIRILPTAGDCRLVGIFLGQPAESTPKRKSVKRPAEGAAPATDQA